MKNTIALISFSTSLLIMGCATEAPPESTKTHPQKAPIPITLHQPVLNKPAGNKEQREREAKPASIIVSKPKVEADMVTQGIVAYESIAPYRAALAKRAAPQLSDAYIGPQSNTENYRHREENSIKLVDEAPVSTFSIDVDTASYAVTRRFLRSGSLPHNDSVRPEEFINYFGYSYPVPDNRDQPFSIYTEVAPSPWAEGKHLLHIGLKGYEVPQEQRPATNLTFLVDVSGSMNQANKLPLLKTSLKLLTQQLSAKDKVSIVVYAGAAGTVLEPTSGNDRAAISAALDRLQAGGSTNGGAGIELAYATAQQSFIKGGINRVILATDGDFNVGVSNIDALKKLIENKRESGIGLTTLGFGQGNYNDALMNELAEIGNGNSAYIDTALEARKVLVDEVGSTLMTIAKDVKIQIEFSPQVAEYRLVGYESRMLNREDFNNDAKDAGEIGAGHTVTALYEIALKDSGATSVDPLRYQHESRPHSQANTDELAFVKLRYKQPDADTSQLVMRAVKMQKVKPHFTAASNDFRFSAAAAAFAQKLRGSDYVQAMDYSSIYALANESLGQDTNGYRKELLNLIRMADTLGPVSAMPVATVATKEAPIKARGMRFGHSK